VVFYDNNGRERVWEIVKRKIFGPIVSVAPLTAKQEIILEKNYRHTLIDMKIPTVIPLVAHILSTERNIFGLN